MWRSCTANIWQWKGQTLLTDLDAVADRPEEYLSLIMVKKQ